jgi:hypothetical protein
MQHQPKQRRQHPLPMKTRRTRQSPCVEEEDVAPARQKEPARRSQRRSNRPDEVVAPRRQQGEVAVLRKQQGVVVAPRKQLGEVPLADTTDLPQQHNTVARAR